MTAPTPNTRKNTFVSDQPSASDYLDFNPYVSGLVDLITARETQTPLTLGISGSWGSGKTTLMRLMVDEVSQRMEQEKKEQKEKGGKERRTLECLWINVWQVSQRSGEGGQALLQALFTEVRSRLRSFHRISFAWYLLRDRINIKELSRQLAVNSYRILIVIAPMMIVWFATRGKATDVDKRLSAGVSALLALWLVLKPMLETARENLSLDLGAILDEVPYENKVSALQKLEQHFERLVKEWVGADGRVVVFIDDLDRCSPDRIAETLEALKLFVTRERCVYVLGIDQDVVAQSIQTKYKDVTGAAADGLPLEGARYLEKIVQLPFMLPQIELTDIRGYVESFNVAWPHDGCADVFIYGLPPNPRQLKRAINVFFLLWQLAKSRTEKLGPKFTELRLAKVVALQTAHPDLFDWFKNTPSLVRDLESYYLRPEERKLIEEKLKEDGKRFAAAVMRPRLQRMFEVFRDNPLATFGELNDTDLMAYFSLTRSVSGISPDASTTVKVSDTPVVSDTQADVLPESKTVSEVTSEVAPSPSVTSLHQLPPPPRDFTGREAQFSEILSKIEDGEVTICCVQGLAGVGKSAFALKLAEKLLSRYPEAQFHLDLKGTSDKPLTVVEALSHVIRAFYAASQLPEGEADLRALFRSVLHGRRALLFMDNAADAAQVEPLAPPEGCLLIITTRQRFTLPGLTAVSLETLPPADASAFLLKIAPRIDDQADKIAQLCGYLPLALRLAASLLAERPDLSPGEYVKSLSDKQKRLELVEASLSLSYELLSTELQGLLRMIAVFPGDFDAKAAGAVWEKEADASKKSLGELVKFSMVEWNESASRYHLNNFARLFADARLNNVERQAAQERHSIHYSEVVEEAHELFSGGGEAIKGLELFDAEWMNIEVGEAWAELHLGEGPMQASVRYALYSAQILALRQPPSIRIRWLESSLKAVRAQGNPEIEILLLGHLGVALTSIGNASLAIQYYEEALAIAQQADKHRDDAEILGHLGQAYADLGDTQRAIESYEKQFAIANNIGDLRAQGIALGNLGVAQISLGRPKEAIEFFERLLVIANDTGARLLESFAFGNLGKAYMDLGETNQALKYLEQALTIAREFGDRPSEGSILFNMSEVYAKLRDLGRAIELGQSALTILVEIESPNAAMVRKRIDEWRKEAAETPTKKAQRSSKKLK